MDISVGSDPEIFIRRDNKLDAAYRYVKGKKGKPIKCRNGAVISDNIMLELNPKPAKNEDEFVTNLRNLLNEVESFYPEISFDISPSVDFDPNTFNEEEAYVFGCEPYYDVYTSQVIAQSANNQEDKRYAGGHIHIGYDDFIDPFDLVKFCDVFLGVPSVLYDSDDSRRAIYGKPGSFRITDYGIEYRTLSNYWVKSEEYMRQVFKSVNKAITHALKFSYEDFLRSVGISEEDVKNCIITSDKENAKLILRKVTEYA